MLGAGVLATLMAVRPLGAVRLLARYAVWVALAATAYLFVPGAVRAAAAGAGGRRLVVLDGRRRRHRAAGVVVPAGRRLHPARPRRRAPPASARRSGYGTATVAFFTLGVLALSAYGAAGLDVIDALLAVPLGLLAVLLLVAVEVDEVFANVYSTAVSAQNLASRADRRLLAVAVGVVATALALTFDIASYEPFLFLIGAVFVPLAGVLVVAYYLVPRGAWDVSDTAPARPLLLLPWAAGFVAYQLTLPTFFSGPGAGWTAWWGERQADLGISATNGLSASIVSLTVATVLTALVTVPAAARARSRA